MQIGFWKNSYTLFARTLDVTRNNGLAENNFGMALMEMGQVSVAKPHLEAAVRLIPEFAAAHYNLGIALQGENQLEQAAKQYQLAITTSTDRLETAQAHNNLGALYLQSKNLGAAKSEFNAAIALNPAEVHSYLGRGMIEQQGWDYNAAAEDFAHAASMSPSPLAFLLLGRALEGKGQMAQAKVAYSRALRLAPGMAEAQSRLAALEQTSNQ
jgi:tetratricopeptide (TPR) repeat protein